MKWMLIVLIMGTTPVRTGLVYDTVDTCYAAEDEMASEYTRYYNDWIAWAKDHPKESGYPTIPNYISQRLMRGVCIPVGNSN